MTALEAAEAAMCRPWAWGAADCCTGACDAFLALHGVDPMAPLRGLYATQAEAEALIADFGGFEPMAMALAWRAGLTATQAPEDGAIGYLPGRRALALRLGDAWAAKSPRGMTIVREGALAWRI